MCESRGDNSFIFFRSKCTSRIDECTSWPQVIQWLIEEIVLEAGFVCNIFQWPKSIAFFIVELYPTFCTTRGIQENFIKTVLMGLEIFLRIHLERLGIGYSLESQIVVHLIVAGLVFFEGDNTPGIVHHGSELCGFGSRSRAHIKDMFSLLRIECDHGKKWGDGLEVKAPLIKSIRTLDSILLRSVKSIYILEERIGCDLYTFLSKFSKHLIGRRVECIDTKRSNPVLRKCMEHIRECIAKEDLKSRSKQRRKHTRKYSEIIKKYKKTSENGGFFVRYTTMHVCEERTWDRMRWRTLRQWEEEFLQVLSLFLLLLEEELLLELVYLEWLLLVDQE